MSVCVCVCVCVVSNVPAVDKHRAFGWSVLFLNLPVEGQDGSGIIRHSMIRPGSEVELSHFQWTLRTSLELEKEREFHTQVEREGGREGGRERGVSPALPGFSWCSQPEFARQTW